MKKKFRDIMICALKTFIEGFLGALVVTLPSTNITNMAVIKSILIGAISGGVSALINFIINIMKKNVI